MNPVPIVPPLLHSSGRKVRRPRVFGLLVMMAPVLLLVPGAGAQEAPDIIIEHPAGTALRRSSFSAWGDDVFGQAHAPPGLEAVAAIAARGAHSVALKSDGTVVAWGYNPEGQSTVPNGLTGIVAIAAGVQHTLALKSDGTVVGWGLNGSGQATAPFGLSGVIAISAGDTHSVALTSDGGMVVAWGANSWGQSSVPAGLGEVTAIAAGDFHTVALKSDGTVAAWGANDFGQSAVPLGLTRVTAIAAGGAHTLALKSEGTVVAWGANTYGQATVPAGLAGVVAIAGGWQHSVAAKADGTVVAWGYNNAGQSSVPAGLKRVTAVAAGQWHTLALEGGSVVDLGNLPAGVSSPAKTFTIKNAGNTSLAVAGVSVIADSAGEFTVHTGGMLTSVPDAGGTTTFTVTFMPDPLGPHHGVLRVISDDPDQGTFDIGLRGSSLSQEIGVAGNGIEIFNGAAGPSGADHTDFGICSVAGDRVVHTFTISNTGAGALSLTGTPKVAVSGAAAADFTVIAEPSTPIAALTGTTTFQIAFVPREPNLRTASVSIPSYDDDENPFAFTIQGTGILAPEIVIEQPAGALDFSVVAWGRNVEGQATVPAGLTGVRAVGAGRSHTIALKNDGTVLAWGDNTYGQRDVPAGLSGVTAISAGDYHSLALKSNGVVVAWGRNDGGQTAVPAGLSGVKAISAGRLHNLALKSDGKVVAWGSNASGQTDVPFALTQATAIAAGFSHSVALKSDGTVIAWGSNNFGQLTVPPGLTNVTGVAAGYCHTLALKGDRTVAAWGYNTFSQTNVPSGLTGVTAIAADYYQSVALKTDGSVAAWGYNSDGQTTVPAGLTDVTAIEEGGFHTVALQPNLFGNQTVATTSAPKTFIIKNTGSAPLTVSTVDVSGDNVADFSVDTTGMLTSVPAFTGTTAFTVTFTPSATGRRRAMLRIGNDDPDEGGTVIVLAGSGVPVGPALAAYQAWAAAVPLTESAALPNAAPHGDGIANLLKYSFNLDASRPDASLLTPGTGTRGLPVISVTGAGAAWKLRVEYVRRRSAGLVYTPLRSANLASFVPMTGIPVVTTIDADWERVIVEQVIDASTSPEQFARVSVTVP